MIEIAKSAGLFVLAGLCEIGGGYLVWQCLREKKPLSFLLLGAVFLILYGMVAAQLPANFGRAYAAYGGVFVAMSLWWGWKIDKTTPDRYDLIGGLIALLGVAIIMYTPRR
jgi:small multidrug resistance family-3 protein